SPAVVDPFGDACPRPRCNHRHRSRAGPSRFCRLVLTTANGPGPPRGDVVVPDGRSSPGYGVRRHALVVVELEVWVEDDDRFFAVVVVEHEPAELLVEAAESRLPSPGLPLHQSGRAVLPFDVPGLIDLEHLAPL